MKIEDIKIDEEFKNLLPGLSDDELRRLKENIITDGEIREPFIVWDGLLVDGHNRRDVWVNLTDEERGKVSKHSFILKQFDSREAVKDWMIKKQLGQRNLSAKDRAYLVGLKYEAKKKNEQDNLKKGKNPLVSPKVQNEPSGDTATVIAEEVGESRSQVKRDVKFKKAIDAIEKHLGAEAKKELMDKKNKVSKVKIIGIGESDPEKMQVEYDRAMGRGTPSGGNSFEPAEWGGKEESNGVKDGLGCIVPNDVAGHFNDAEGLTEVLNHITQAKKKLNALCKKTCCYEIKFQNVESDLNNAVQQIKPYAPFTECPRCKRKLVKKCDLCKGTGIISHAKHGSGKGGGVLTSEEKEWLKNRA